MSALTFDVLVVTIALLALYLLGSEQLPKIAAAILGVAVVIVLWRALSSELVATYLPLVHVPSPLEVLTRLWSSAI